MEQGLVLKCAKFDESHTNSNSKSVEIRIGLHWQIDFLFVCDTRILCIVQCTYLLYSYSSWCEKRWYLVYISGSLFHPIMDNQVSLYGTLFASHLMSKHQSRVGKWGHKSFVVWLMTNSLAGWENRIFDGLVFRFPSSRGLHMAWYTWSGVSWDGISIGFFSLSLRLLKGCEWMPLWKTIVPPQQITNQSYINMFNSRAKSWMVLYFLVWVTFSTKYHNCQWFGLPTRTRRNHLGTFLGSWYFGLAKKSWNSHVSLSILPIEDRSRQTKLVPHYWQSFSPQITKTTAPTYLARYLPITTRPCFWWLHYPDPLFWNSKGETEFASTQGEQIAVLPSTGQNERCSFFGIFILIYSQLGQGDL